MALDETMEPEDLELVLEHARGKVCDAKRSGADYLGSDYMVAANTVLLSKIEEHLRILVVDSPELPTTGGIREGRS